MVWDCSLGAGNNWEAPIKVIPKEGDWSQRMTYSFEFISENLVLRGNYMGTLEIIRLYAHRHRRELTSTYSITEFYWRYTHIIQEYDSHVS